MEDKLNINKCGESRWYLVHGGSILEDDKTLEDYPSLHNGSTLFLLATLLGGAEANPDIDPAIPRSDEYCMVTHENYEENGTVVLMMPCGHPISPGGLMDYCWSELNAYKTEIRCLLCTREWTVDVILKYGGASKEEFQQIEKRLSLNFCITSDDIKMCRKCNSFCSRINKDNSCVTCKVCSKNSSTSYQFCWYCLREWKNTGSQNCGYEDCHGKENLERLQNTDKIIVQQNPKIEIYALRACPCCGEIMRCTDEKWKAQCVKCNTEFCFICLRPKSQGSWFCGSQKVDCTLAPIQRKIPHKESTDVELKVQYNQALLV